MGVQGLSMSHASGLNHTIPFLVSFLRSSSSRLAKTNLCPVFRWLHRSHSVSRRAVFRADTGRGYAKLFRLSPDDRHMCSKLFAGVNILNTSVVLID